jgi:hypothetical protein
MASIPYALSITHFINSVGAKAGFASIIGLALLVLLFFTQSRETANLRRRADEAEQQLYQLQLYVDHLSRQRTQHAVAPAPPQTTSAPVAAPPAAALALAGASRAIPGEQAAPAGGGVATLIPAAPAGVGAPALSSATRLIPLTEPDEISIRALRPSTNGDGDGEGPAGAVSDATVATPPPAPPPSTAAGGGNGVARPPVPVPMPTMGGGLEPAPPPRVALPRQQQRPPGRPPVGPPPTRRGGQGSSGRRISPVFFVLAGVLAAAVVAVVLIFVTGSNSSSSSSSSAASAGSASSSQTNAAQRSKNGRQRKAATATVTPSSVTVAVLNGTATNNLAHDVAAKLATAGYKAAGTLNASETGLTSTIVGYTASSARNDALAVAKSLDLGPASVQGASQGDRLKVCSSTTTCTTQVIVTAGADLSQTG